MDSSNDISKLQFKSIKECRKIFSRAKGELGNKISRISFSMYKFYKQQKEK